MERSEEEWEEWHAQHRETQKQAREFLTLATRLLPDGTVPPEVLDPTITHDPFLSGQLLRIAGNSGYLASLVVDKLEGKPMEPTGDWLLSMYELVRDVLIWSASIIALTTCDECKAKEEDPNADQN